MTDGEPRPLAVYVVSLMCRNPERINAVHNAVDVLARVVEGSGAGTASVGRRMAVFIVPEDRVGDAAAFEDRVLRYREIYGTLDEPTSRRRAESILALADEEGLTDAVGTALIRRILEGMLLDYDCLTIRSGPRRSAPPPFFLYS